MASELTNQAGARGATVRLAAMLGVVAFLLPVMGCREETPISLPHKVVENMTHVATVAQFEQVVLNAQTPVLVDMYATWCPPCKRLAPVLDRLAPRYKGKVAFVEVDVDKVPDLAKRYRVTAIPTLLIFKNGKEARRMRGAPPEATLRAALDAASG